MDSIRRSHNTVANCGDCRMNALCLPLALQENEIALLDKIVQRGRPLQKNNHIYYAGVEFKSVFAVRSGSIKSYTVTHDGQEQVTGFHLPGEIFGMDGIAHNHYTNSAIALETTAICEIPFSNLQELSIAIPSLQSHFFQLMSKEITNDQSLFTLLSKNTAEQRVATLLLSISNRHMRRNLSRTHFILPMSRADIGNYLGLTVETVSRIFSRLQKQGLLLANKKEIEILDLDSLKKLSN